MRSSVSNRSFRSGLLFGARSRRLTGRLSVAHRNYHEFACGKPRRTLSSQLSGKLMDSTLSAPCAELAAFWRAGLAEHCRLCQALAFIAFRRDFHSSPPSYVGPGPPSISAELHLGIREREAFEGDSQ